MSFPVIRPVSCVGSGYSFQVHSASPLVFKGEIYAIYAQYIKKLELRVLSQRNEGIFTKIYQNSQYKVSGPELENVGRMTSK